MTSLDVDSNVGPGVDRSDYTHRERNLPRGLVRLTGMRQRILVIASLAAAAALAGCAGHGAGGANDSARRSTASQSKSRTADSRSHQPLVLQIRLKQRTVPAGQPIHGLAIVTNRNRQGLVIGTCNHVWLQVGLVNAKIPFEPAWETCADIPGTTVEPGTTRMPITIHTTYWQCVPHARSATRQAPVCVHGHMPPLPPGTYTTKPVALTPEGARVKTSHPIKVTLTA